jgi:hypothetical protein
MLWALQPLRELETPGTNWIGAEESPATARSQTLDVQPVTSHIMEFSWTCQNYIFDLFLNHAVRIARLKINLHRTKMV